MLTKFTSLVGLALTLVGFSLDAAAQSGVEKARLGRIIWSAFQCGTFAEMSGNEKEQARLFEIGVKAGREFLDALKNRQIPPDVASREVPMGVSMLLQGPTPDFIIGRIFENAMRDAYDEIVKRENGLPLDASKWTIDEALRKSKAQTNYLKSNCVLLK